jgi:repressor LexA
MKDVKDIIKSRREELNLTMKDIAKRVGVSEGTVSRWESGDIQNMRRDKIVALANALQISPSVIMGWDENIASPPIKLGNYRIPVVAVVAAGVPIYSEDNITGWIDYDKDPHGDVFALQIKGDSMSPKISNGDIVIVDKSQEWEDNDIVIVRVNGQEGTCKRLKMYDDGISLISINPSYEPMYYTKEEVQSLPVEVVGRVMESRSKL